jgi:uncharacterized protein involved in type VI secretion and phage assembly
VHQVVQTIRDIARHEYNQHWSACLGVVKSVQGQGQYSCTVRLRETQLVLPEVPIATGLLGTVGLPAEDDLVVVLFAGGDLHAPVVIGRLHNEKIVPPNNDPGTFTASLPAGETADDKRLQLNVVTPGDGSRKLHLVLDGNVKVELLVDDSGLELKAQDTSLTLKQSSSSDGKAELKVGSNTISVEQSGNITVEAQGTLKLKASQIEISGDTTVKIAGQTVNLN